MRVDHRERRVLLEQVLERGDQYRVLEHVGVVAGVEGVAVAEHAAMLTVAPDPSYNQRLCSAWWPRGKVSQTRLRRCVGTRLRGCVASPT